MEAVTRYERDKWEGEKINCDLVGGGGVASYSLCAW